MRRSNKYICIHGHFYQPPRENAWLEVVEVQDSASPFHDWNSRINFESYAPNTAARILDDDQYIVKILNNYSRISFNFGPTLLSWMEKNDPETYEAILEADRQSMEHFGGHGSAIAQVHSHLILPLANERDKETQVIWGIRDFEHRFGRAPEGMWLAETAVDTETLEVLARNGIRFTILAPRQARAFRRPGAEKWEELSHEGIDTRRPYLCRLPSGRSIALFFYHGQIAQAVAFEGLLNHGKSLAHRLAGAFGEGEEPQLVNIATDGESYGHHHHKGEMALADCLNHIEEHHLAQLTNYGQYLELFPPQWEVRIWENSSWSCVHGVERWRSNCGCNSGGNPGWNQAWRGPLRETLNWLRDQIAPIYQKEAAKLVKDVWTARNEYIEVLLDRTPRNTDRFISRHALRPLDQEEEISLLRLMEMQRNAMLMFTSCGWFFDEVSGIETNQILQYANRAIYYAQQVGRSDLHPAFLKRLEAIPSNIHRNGAVSYRDHVMPARVDLVRVAMHFAASSLFEAYPERLELFNYEAESEVFHRYEAGIQRLALGRTTIRSRITRSRKKFSFAVLYLGQQNIIGNISIDMDRETFDTMSLKMVESFNTPNLGEVIALMQQYFGPEKYTIWHLFRDEKRKILDQIVDRSLRQVEAVFREIYNDNYQLMTSMVNAGIPVPEAYQNAVRFVINHDLDQFFTNGHFRIRELNRLISEVEKWGIKLNNEPSLNLSAGERIFREIKKLYHSEMDLPQLQNLIQVLERIQALGLNINLWKSQNLYFSMLKGYQFKWVFANEDWKKATQRLGDLLRVRLPD